jgi:hypothetical protein
MGSHSASTPVLWSLLLELNQQVLQRRPIMESVLAAAKHCLLGKHNQKVTTHLACPAGSGWQLRWCVSVFSTQRSVQRVAPRLIKRHAVGRLQYVKAHDLH